MWKKLSLLGWLTCLLFFCGCNTSSPAYDKALLEVLDSLNDLTNSLQSVHNAASAQSVIPSLDSKFLRYRNATLAIYNSKGVIASPNVSKEFTNKFPLYKKRYDGELTRLVLTNGLPLEFWRIVTPWVHKMAYQSPSAPPEANYFREVDELRTKHGYEKVVTLAILQANPETVSLVQARLQKRFPDATFIPSEDCLVFGSIPDFSTVRASLDFGTIQNSDEGQRLIRLTVDLQKLNAPNPIGQLQNANEGRVSSAPPSLNNTPPQAKSFLSSFDPSDPQYYDKLVDALLAGSPTEQEEILKVLLKTTPSQVASLETRKKIAKAFKQLAEEDKLPLKKEVTKGLVIWGGKYSGPILLKMLGNPGSYAEEDILRAMSQIKYGPAASAFASRLGNQAFHQLAFDTLKELGPDAEEALLQIRPSEPNDRYLSAIQLLGFIGTEKCVSFLRRGISQKDSILREASKESLKMVTARQKEAKEKKTKMNER